MSFAVRQLLTFLLYVACGVTVAFLFHLTTLIRPKGGRAKKAVSALSDTMFAVAALAFLWWFNLKINGGAFTLHLLLGFFAGFAIYFPICKTALDKAFLALYNFFTVRTVRKGDEKNISE